MEILTIDTYKCVIEVLRRTVRRAKEIAGIRISKKTKLLILRADMISLEHKTVIYRKNNRLNKSSQ